MSFLNNLTQNINPYKRKKYNYRKEKQDSPVVVQKTLKAIQNRERASAFASKGSLTLEAAIIVPVFFFAMLCLAYLLEMMAIQTTMRNALYSVGKEAARHAYTSKFLSSGELERKIVENIGEEKLKRSAVSGGANGIDCSKTKNNWSTGVMDLIVEYRVEIPVAMFRLTPITCRESIRVKGWNGFVSSTGDALNSDTVYVTDTGIVYHRDSNCTYLDMSVQSVHVDAIDELRNQSGGKYYACESCGDNNTDKDIRYITNYGTRYHTSLECKKIKRNVYAISVEETYGLGGCSKCVK